MEGSARILALVKLANVGLVLIWGFAVTYVFVRVLPLREFQSFLLLVAFGNFTISAEFGLTSIIYARLRRYWLGNSGPGNSGPGNSGRGKGEAGGFGLGGRGGMFLFLGRLHVGGVVVLLA